MSLLRINRTPSSRQLLTFAVAWMVVAGTIAAVNWEHGRLSFAIIGGGAALAMPALFLIHPASVRRAFVGLSHATYPIGLVVSYAVMAALYFGIFTPLGFVARLFGYDPLASRFAPLAQTYWQPRESDRDVAQYFRQR